MFVLSESGRGCGGVVTTEANPYVPSVGVLNLVFTLLNIFSFNL